MLYAMTDGWRNSMRNRSLLRLVSAGAIGSLALSGCVSGGPGTKSSSPSASASGKPSSAKPSKEPALQTRILEDDKSTLQVDVLSLARLSNSALKLRIRITTIGEEDDTITSDFGSDDFSRVSLIDGKGMKAYFPLASKSGTEMQDGYPENAQLPQGASAEASIFFPSPPANITKLNINNPNNPPFVDIPVQGAAKVENGEPDPGKVALDKPRIEDLISMTDDLGGEKSVDEGKDKVDIRLNADVLFALNKAKLTGKAESVLKDVASRIDRSSSKTINVDGYTDSSGNDKINKPLSRRRAEAVASELKKLVTRSGVTYESAGHGSGDPVASNDSSKGRQKNRRVTVTIGK